METKAVAEKSVHDVAAPFADLKMFDPAMGAFNLENFGQAMQFASMMAKAGPMIPEFMRDKPPICLAVTMRAIHWGFDPFALAQECYQAKANGPVGYQSKIFQAVLNTNGFTLEYRFEGEFAVANKAANSAKGNEVSRRSAGGSRKCIASATVNGVRCEYETPELDQITIKNSPLWHNDPDQQLAYYAARGWARRHKAELMMGAYSADEVKEMTPNMRDVSPSDRSSSGFVELGKQARTAAIAKNDTEEKSRFDVEKEAAPAEDTSEAADGEIMPEGELDIRIDTESPAFQMGAKAGEEPDLFSVDHSPFKEDGQEMDDANWRAGFISVAGIG